MKSEIYLDNNTIAKPDEKAISAMMPYLTDHWGVATQPHQFGQELYPSIEEAYRSIYQLLGAKQEDTILFTGSGAEAINQVIQATYVDVTLQTGKNQFLTSVVDEAPTIRALGRMEEMGCVVKMIQVNEHGQVTVDALSDLVTPRTALLSLSWANGLTGVIHPIDEISEFCKERGIRLHLDATHVLGKRQFSFEEVHADFITFNGCQIHSLKGTGGLWIKEDVTLSPLILGGLEQGGLRGGNLDISSLVNLGRAAREMIEAKDYMLTETVRLRNFFEEQIIHEIPEAIICFQDDERLPNISAICFPNVMNESLLYLLDRNKLYANIGGGSFQQLGLILKACNFPHYLYQTAISFSLSRYTTQQDLENAAKIIGQQYQYIKQCWKDGAS